MMDIDKLLMHVRSGDLEVDEAKAHLDELLKSKESEAEASADLGFATVDLDRERRTGFPEVIFGEGKTAEQITAIFRKLMQSGKRVLATRVSSEKAQDFLAEIPEAQYNPTARTLTWFAGGMPPKSDLPGYIAVVCAGTSDLPVAEEAAVTAECMGCPVERVTDVGVAGIHRLFGKLELIRGADVIVVAAGMEGALSSVVGGLVDKPIIAIPTSIGYGASFGGVAALLAMLNSCAPGVTVVNIDNGFGAGYAAGVIYLNQTKRL